MSAILLSLPQRYKRLIQAMTLAVAIIYTTLMLYQSTYGYPNMQLPTPTQQPQQQQPQPVLPAQIAQPVQNAPTISTQNAAVAVAARTVAAHAPAFVAISQEPTVILRKDIHNFNFTDIEVNEDPKALLLNDLARRSRNGELLHDLSQRAVTATPQPPITELDDIFISVKTTKNYHNTRLALIIKTWFQLARDQTWFFTDTDDPYYQEKTKGHLINTKCPQGHFRKALCCKMSAELDVFLESGKNLRFSC